MAVIFNTFDDIEIDGIPAGNIADVISNHAPRRVEVLAAARAYAESKDATITTLQARITELEQYRPYNPRWLDGVAFYKRISQQDMETLLASDNPMLVTVGKTILAYRDNHTEWPVILDSPEFQNLVGYVLQSGVFDEEEVVAIMRDATREEAYVAE